MISSRQFVAARKDTPRRHVPSPAHDGDEDRISKTISASQVQQIQQNPGALSTAAVLHLQRTIGNQATLRLLSGGKPKHCAQGPSGNPQITQPSATETIQRLITSKQLSKRAGSPIVAEPGFTQYSQILNKLRTYHSFIVANTLGQEGSIEPSDINQFQIQTKTRLETVREACQAYLRIVVDESPRRTHISGILDDVKQEVLAINAVVAARKAA